MTAGRANNDTFAPSACPDRTAVGLLPFREALEAGLIERRIQPLVVALNECGATTIASCEGHGSRRGLFLRPYMESRPFVLFRADQEWARRFANRIAYGRGQRYELHFNWGLSGYFYPSDLDLVWTLEPADVRLPSEWDRSKIDQDIAALSNIVRATSLADPLVPYGRRTGHEFDTIQAGTRNQDA